MSPLSEPSLSDEFRPPWWLKLGVWTVAATLLAIEFHQGVFRRENDYRWHIVQGQHFLARRPERITGDWYPLGRIAWDGVVALLPYRLGRGMMFLLGVGALVGALALWAPAAGFPTLRSQRTQTAAWLSVLAAAVLIQRDLDECGLQLFLLGLLSLALWLHLRGKVWGTGAALAAAASYKSTPLVFLPYLIWKRQWCTAWWMVVFLLVWNLLPAAYWGWEATWKFHRRWWDRALAQARLEDPSRNAVEPPNVRNQALSVALARLLQTYPPGSPLHLDHPAFFQWGGFDPRSAAWAVKLLLGALALLVAWKFRPWPQTGFGEVRWADEWAVVSGLCALLSPLCWKHHLVLIVPGFYLLTLEVLHKRTAGRRAVAWLLVLSAGLMLLPGRALWGQELALVWVSYKPYTWAALIIVLTLLVRMPEVRPNSTSLLAENSSPVRTRKAA